MPSPPAHACILSIGVVDLPSFQTKTFWLSEDIYVRNYFKQTHDGDEQPVKLPIKWMAIESLMDAIFNEETDVVRYLSINVNDIIIIYYYVPTKHIAFRTN